MPQGPNYGLQSGSTWVISDEGTITIGAGGSINVESGGVINVAAGGSITGNGVSLTAPVFNIITLGGTAFRASYGTTGLTSGVGTVATGLTRVFSANANTILGEAQSVGSASHVMVDLSLSGAGSVIYRIGSVGGGVWAANGTVSWQAVGT